MGFFEKFFDCDAYADPQQRKPFIMCCCCGKEIYRPMQQTCDICLMDIGDDDDDYNYDEDDE
jgi:hypothetical protein